jgi:hypothetical protein
MRGGEELSLSAPSPNKVKGNHTKSRKRKPSIKLS